MYDVGLLPRDPYRRPACTLQAVERRTCTEGARTGLDPLSCIHCHMSMTACEHAHVHVHQSMSMTMSMSMCAVHVHGHVHVSDVCSACACTVGRPHRVCDRYTAVDSLNGGD